MHTAQQYERCLVLAGGGFRFGYYLGIHAAAEETGNAPDVLLASCGGALAAAVIAALPDAASRKAWLLSPPMFAFLHALRSSPRAAPVPVLARALRRWLANDAATRVPDLFDDYLFELPDQLPLPPLPLPLPLSPRHGGGPALAIVGSKLLFAADAVGQPRAGRHLFAQVVFGDARTAALLDGMAAPASDPRWSADAIAPQLLAETAMPWHAAARISIADMFYFRCIAHDNAHGSAHYAGGVIDLFPIELAHRLARRVAMEAKPPFGRWLALPALRSVFGIDGAARLRHMHAQDADAWIDTMDMSRALRGQGVGKRIAWRANRIRLVPPATPELHAQQIEAQWQYGYRQGLAAFGRAGGRRPFTEQA